MREHPDLVAALSADRACPSEHDKFSALHAAFWSGGSFLYVPRERGHRAADTGARLRRRRGAAIFAHTLIVLEAGAEAAFIDEFISPTAEGAQGFSEWRVELFTGAGAHLRYFSVQAGAATSTISTRSALIADRDGTTNS